MGVIPDRPARRNSANSSGVSFSPVKRSPMPMMAMGSRCSVSGFASGFLLSSGMRETPLFQGKSAVLEAVVDRAVVHEALVHEALVHEALVREAVPHQSAVSGGG